MQSNIKEAVTQALAGSRQVKITFKRDAIPDIAYLFGMIKNGIVSVRGSDEMVLQAVRESRRWEGEQNRTVVVTLTQTFDEEFFVGRMTRALEKIEVINKK